MWGLPLVAVYVPVHDKIRSEGFAVAANISYRSGGALTQYPLRPLVVCMCEMAGIVDDEEIAESDSDWALNQTIVSKLHWRATVLFLIKNLK